MKPGEIQLSAVSEEIEAGVSDVWSLLTDFANPQRLAPTIIGCSALGHGVGAIRIVESSRKLVIYERLLECDKIARRFRYEVLDTGDMPFADVTSYECTVTLASQPRGRTRIEWSSVGRVNGPLEPITDFLDALYFRATDCIRAAVARERET